MIKVAYSSLTAAPAKWIYPLHLIREDGKELVCCSDRSRSETRKFLRDNNLLEMFDDIVYNVDPDITDLRHLLPLCTRQWTRTRLYFCLSHSPI